MADRLRQILDVGLEQTGLELGDAARTRLLDYLRLLTQWNTTYNLTAVRDPSQMIYRHLLDSIVALPHLRGPRILDVGTGAGLPGIVLAVARPDLQCVLLDSTAKKTRFCIQAVGELGLTNVAVVWSRVEHYSPDAVFSTIIARAFGRVGALLCRTRHLRARHGRWIAMKGANPGAEIEEVRGMGENAQVFALTVPGLPRPRHLVVVEPGEDTCGTAPRAPSARRMAPLIGG